MSSSTPTVIDDERVPDWIAALQRARPGVAIPKPAKPLADVLFDERGKVISTAEAWEARRARILASWRAFLGAIPEPHSGLDPVLGEMVTLEDGVRRRALELQVENGVRMRCYLFIPSGRGPFPACICLHSTTDETIRQPAGLGAQPEKAFALDLARRGYVTIAPENFLWRYRLPPSPPGEARRGLYEARAAAFSSKYPGAPRGMAKMIHDASRCVDYLETLPIVRDDAIGAIGHSLGGKEVTFLMALDERVRCGVSSEGGVAFEFSNYHDVWYLGKESREDNFARTAQEILALIAPRAWLLIGGNSADGDKSWPWVESVLPVYRLLGQPANAGLLVHDAGHAVPEIARETGFRWLDENLGVSGR